MHAIRIPAPLFDSSLVRRTLHFSALLVLTALFLIGMARPVHADDLDAAMVLVAKPDFADPVYSHSVIIVTPMDGGGHIGIIVNRPTKESLASLFPEHAPSKQVHDPVYFGGPMLTEVIFALVHSDASPGEGTLQMTKGLFLAIKETTIDHVIEKTPNDAHYFVGTVVWQPGELQAEVKHGLWSVMAPDTAVVFDQNPERLWDHLQAKANALSVFYAPAAGAGSLPVLAYAQPLR